MCMSQHKIIKHLALYRLQLSHKVSHFECRIVPFRLMQVGECEVGIGYTDLMETSCFLKVLFNKSLTCDSL